MSTRSTIGIQCPDGTVLGVYCHWDGYPEHNGRILLENYTTTEKVKALLALGSLSILGSELGEKHDFDKHDNDYKGCTAYGRDRGEKDAAAKTYKNVNEFAHEEYAYIFDPEIKTWSFCEVEGKRIKFKLLTAMDCQNK